MNRQRHRVRGRRRWADACGRRWLALCALALVAGVAPARAADEPRVTMIGDSVPAALGYVRGAERVLAQGLDLRLDLRVCRRLVAASCPYQGRTPSTGLEAVQADGSALGQTVVIDVGYNDDGTHYVADMDRVLRALQGAGVRRVVWVTLREERSDYVRVNAAIRHEAALWPRLVQIADWNEASYEQDGWFASDGLHLSDAGAFALAHFLRAQLAVALRANHG